MQIIKKRNQVALTIAIRTHNANFDRIAFRSKPGGLDITDSWYYSGKFSY